MPLSKLGPLVLETTRQRQFTDRLFIAVEKFRCERGRGFIYERLHAPMEIKPQIQMRTLQRSELARLIAALKGIRPAVRNLAGLAERLKKALNLAELTVDPKDRPQTWRHGEKCFDVVIGYYRIYEQMEVIVRAGRQLTLEGETYPKDDIIARLVIDDVLGYQFARKSIYNPHCCPRRAERNVPRDSEIRADPVYKFRFAPREWEDMFKHFDPGWRLPRHWRFRYRPGAERKEEEKGIRVGIKYRF